MLNKYFNNFEDLEKFTKKYIKSFKTINTKYYKIFQ